MTPPTQAAAPRGLAAAIARANRLGSAIPFDAVLFAARLFPAAVFWASARTKVEGFAIKDSTFFLFEYEYALPIIPPAVAAVLATIAEHVLPVLLAAGFMTRLAALGLLGMTAVIQTFVYPGAWAMHGLWAACFLLTLARGPGAASVDRALRLD